MADNREMKLTRRMLVWMTPVGVAIGLYEAWHLAGGLVLLMGLQMLILGIAVVAVVRIVRREARLEEAAGSLPARNGPEERR